MGALLALMLVVDGSDVCRAPVVAFTLRTQLTGWLTGLDVETRGLEVQPGSTMCERASARLGYSGPAIAYYGTHRATRLTATDVSEADLVLTAERQQRSAVVRMLPGSQASVFTWKEALVLASVLTDRVRHGAADAPEDLPGLARALHAARGTVPMIEPTVRTGVLHLRRPVESDPLTVPDGHDGQVQHRLAVQESRDVALELGGRLAGLVEARVPALDGARAMRASRRWLHGVGTARLPLHRAE